MAHLFYLTADTYFYEGGRLRGTGKADYELLKPAEVVIIEENIGVLPAHHVSFFLKHLRTEHRPDERAALVGE
jgi:hypothetical protein